MRRPAVSVLLPARNAARTIGEAIGSVRAQTFADFELVVVDDASTDETPRLLEAIGREEPRLRVVRGRGEGLVAALNVGLEHCSAELIARMDADDVSLPRRLEVSAGALAEDASLGAVGTQVEIFRLDRPVSPNMELYARWLNSLTSKERLRRERFVESPLCHPSATLRRAALEEVGGYRSGNFPEDYELWLSLLDAGWELKCLPEVLFRWRDHDSRLTREEGRYAEERFPETKARWLARGPLKESRRCIVWGAGRTGLALMRRLRDEGVAVERFLEVDPRKIGARIEGVPVAEWSSVGGPAGVHLLAAVGAKGAREEIRQALEARGWIEGRDFTCCA